MRMELGQEWKVYRMMGTCGGRQWLGVEVEVEIGLLTT